MKLKFIWLLVISANVMAQNFTKVTKTAMVGMGNSSSLSFDADNDGLPDVFVMGKSGASYFAKLYHNNGDSTFLDLGLPFPGLAYGSVDVLDANNDGLLDLALCGFDGIHRRFCLFMNKGNNIFMEINTGIPGLDYSTVKCADINNDGWNDIVLQGQSATGKVFTVYQNNGNGTFSPATQLEGLSDGGFDIADINSDGYLDIVSTGINNALFLHNKIYINTTHGFTYTERASAITPITGGTLKMSDFNNDGFPDLIISGLDDNNNQITQVYRNNSGICFTLFATLTGLYQSAITTGDFNNDGFADIILSGLGADGTNRTIFYQNSAGVAFVPQATSLPNVTQGSLSVLDLLGDRKPDVLISGYTMAGPVTSIYNSTVAKQNTDPIAPTELTSLTSNDTVILRWKSPTDAETASKSLTFDIYLKAVSSGDTVFAAPANYTTGQRYIYKPGSHQDTFLIIKNLPYGKYYWSVQAVDAGFEGSAFAMGASFNICYNFSIGKDTSICKGEQLSISTGDANDVVKWYSSASPASPFYTGNTAILTILADAKIWTTVTKPIGCTLTDTMLIKALSLPETTRKDTSVCANTTITLSLAKKTYVADWTSMYGTLHTSDTSTIAYKVLHIDAIYESIKDQNGCKSNDTIAIWAYPLPQSNLPIDTSVCLHNTLKLVAGQNTDTVYWYNSTNILLSNKNEVNFYAKASEMLHLRLVNMFGCPNTDTVNIHTLALPIAKAGRDTLICKGGQAYLGGSYPNPGDYQYAWSPSSINDNATANPIANPTSTTSYILKTTDANACSGFDTVLVTINPPSTINNGGDRFICIGKNVTLGGNQTAIGSTLPYSYQWSPNKDIDNIIISNPTVMPNTTTKYQLVVSTGSCIIDTSYVNVTVWSLPIVSTSKNVTIGYKESCPLLASGGTTYKWEPETGLDEPLIAGPKASPLVTTTYTVFVTDQNGCEANAAVTVTILDGIFVPNLFTPNGDGKNDYFKVYGTGISTINLKVFSAEGVLVYETSSIEEATHNGWDGKFKGNELASGRYLWVINATSTEDKPLLYNNSNKGVITLLK